jgi:2-C-methyl-D-erythritol 2,4-cyclodiphosphate synthase
VQAEGYVLNNLDCTICAERPKLQPYLDKMRENLAKDLACDISQISLKATTEEGLGVSGNGGISSTCILLLRKQ